MAIKDFLKNAFRDMKEGARDQKAVNKAERAAIKAENAANRAELKAANDPARRKAKMRAERDSQIAAAQKRKADAEARITAAKK